ncbi:MAG: hypothetical protein MAG458_00861 [Nitrosopumilus sp.]|nr:hypothetical protein [Nitrosopumilus sp.]
MNNEGLVQTRQIIHAINVPSRITGPNCDNSWYLTISRRDLDKFKNEIGFEYPKKEKIVKKK